MTIFNANGSRFVFADNPHYDAVAIGSPDDFSYIAGTLKTFPDDWQIAKGKDAAGLTDKPVALLMAYDGVGCARQPLELLSSKLSPQVGSTVDCDSPPSQVVLYACYDLRRKLAWAVS